MTEDVAVRVRRAVEDVLVVGCVLRTPDKFKGAEFQVIAIDSKRIKLNKLTVPITWEELEGVVYCLRERGHRGKGYEWVIGSRQESSVDGDTLEGCIRRISGSRTMKSSYVASILGKARIVTVYGGRPNSITLAPDWRR